MSGALRRLLGAAALAGALLAVVLLADEEEPAQAPLATLNPGTVARVALTRPGKPAVVLERSGERWRMVEPIRAWANGTRAAALAVLPATVPVRSYPASDLSLADAGLAPARVALALDDLRFEFGGNDPVEGLRYVRMGDTVHLIRDLNAHHLQATPESFIDLRPLGPGAQVAALDLGTVQVTRGATLTWQPPTAADSADAAAALLARWENVSALSVDRLDLKLRWGNPVSVTLQDGTGFRFIVARTQRGVFLGLRDLAIQYRLPAGPGAALLRLAQPDDGSGGTDG